MQPVIFDSVSALAERIAGQVRAPAIVGVDGWAGAGKTCAAAALAAATGGLSYDLDDALDRGTDRYLGSLRYAEIRRELARRAGLLFVSGICLREVLQRVDRTAAAHVYVKRMAGWGWADEEELDGAGDGSPLHDEMQRYHRDRWPQLTADYELRRRG